MEMIVCGTGSSGNAYYLNDNEQGILLDCGIPFSKILRHVGSIQGLQGCLVTHEHGDHSKAVKELCRRGITCFMTAGTANELKIKSPRIRLVQFGVPVTMGHWQVLAIPTIHDAAEPCGFLIYNSEEQEMTLYATDTYYLPNTYPGVHYWIVECNFLDSRADEMEKNGQISHGMKLRLLKSHMSLRRLKTALSANDLSQTAQIVLVHLSDERSDEERMVQEIQTLTGIDTVAARKGMKISLNRVPF